MPIDLNGDVIPDYATPQGRPYFTYDDPNDQGKLGGPYPGKWIQIWSWAIPAHILKHDNKAFKDFKAANKDKDSRKKWYQDLGPTKPRTAE